MILNTSSKEKGEPMRAIDADAFAEFLKDAVKRQKYDDLNIDGLLTVADVIEAIISELNGTSLAGFKNAPTIELRCENCEAFNKTRLLIPQPERKKGKWIKRDVSRQIHGISCSAPNWQCSVCKKWWFHNGEGLKWYKFCPECGADMRGDDHDL